MVRSLIHAAGVFMYVTGVAWFMSHGESIFGEVESFLVPVFMLLLFVISASITGLLVLGKPIQLYLDGQKREAFTFLFATLAWLIILLVGVVSLLLLQ